MRLTTLLLFLMLVFAISSCRHRHDHNGDHSHDVTHNGDHSHDHGSDYDHAHDHGNGHDHDHDHGHDHGTSYKLTAFAPSVAFADAAITNMTYANGKFAFGIGGDSYKLGVQTPDASQKMCANSAQGQHIHLIVDNDPYAAKYVADFDYDIADGEHHLLAFLSRSYHESIKTDDAHVAKKVSVKNGSITAESDIEAPMIFYSRPKGNYVGDDTKKVMLDFYLTNVDLSDGYRIKAEINGEAHMIDGWQPYYIEGLPMGENTIRLSLLDAQGKLVDAPLNPVERTFTLRTDPADAAK